MRAQRGIAAASAAAATAGGGGDGEAWRAPAAAARRCQTSQRRQCAGPQHDLGWPRRVLRAGHRADFHMWRAAAIEPAITDLARLIAQSAQGRSHAGLGLAAAVGRQAGMAASTATRPTQHKCVHMSPEMALQECILGDLVS